MTRNNVGMAPQEGPPFEETRMFYPILTPRSQQLTAKIDAKIQKGFFKVDGKWTCYRRNYFTVSCAFALKPTTYESQFFIHRHTHQPQEAVRHFAVQISAKTAEINNTESETRQLIQHTPKRDKATETTPGKAVLQPAQVAHASMLTTTGPYHGNAAMYGASGPTPPGMMVDYHSPQYSSAQNQASPQSHTFERIQFQKATANNGKRRAQQQYFHVVVELFADVAAYGDPSWVKIAMAQSHPIVVRGRSPGHYKDNRRGSTASMDPDRGAGGPGDGSGGAPLGSYLGPTHGRSTGMDWDPGSRGPPQMGGGFRHASKAAPSTCVVGQQDRGQEPTQCLTPGTVTSGGVMGLSQCATPLHSDQEESLVSPLGLGLCISHGRRPSTSAERQAQGPELVQEAGAFSRPITDPAYQIGRLVGIAAS